MSMIKRLPIIFSLIFLNALNAENFQDVEYANINGRSLKLDIHMPDDVKNPPLIMWIHGGGWIGGNKNDASFKWITKHGFALASISYRFSTEAIFPAQIHDCKGALRWLKANASKYGYSVEKVGVSGSSAGGQLAAFIGNSYGDKFNEGEVGGNLDQSTKVDAVIDFYGATDFILRAKTQASRANDVGSVCYKLFGGPTSEKTELARQASAVFFLDPQDPPFLIFHGDKDNTVLPDQSQRIHEAYSQAGLKSELVIIKDGSHGGKGFFTEKTRQQMIDFLNQYLR
jgi:acetyl esterase/lipase